MRARLPEERATIERSRVMTAAIREELKKKLADDAREQINQNAGRYDTILAYALKLREKGIDMEEIEKELDEYAKERGIEF